MGGGGVKFLRNIYDVDNFDTYPKEISFCTVRKYRNMKST